MEIRIFLSLVLSKDGKKTYVAENHTDQVKRVYFTDDTYVDVPANSSYVGKKTGDGANPNIDDSELLGNTTKVTVENYLENYAHGKIKQENEEILDKTEKMINLFLIKNKLKNKTNMIKEVTLYL